MVPTVEIGDGDSSAHATDSGGSRDGRLRAVFRQFDVDGDGHLNQPEMRCFAE